MKLILDGTPCDLDTICVFESLREGLRELRRCARCRRGGLEGDWKVYRP